MFFEKYGNIEFTGQLKINGVTYTPEQFLTIFNTVFSKEISTDYNLLIGEKVIVTNPAGVIITLSTAANNDVVFISSQDLNTNAVIRINPASGDTISSGDFLNIDFQYVSIMLIYNSSTTDWRILIL